jgi:hypothetical protein
VALRENARCERGAKSVREPSESSRFQRLSRRIFNGFKERNLILVSWLEEERVPICRMPEIWRFQRLSRSYPATGKASMLDVSVRDRARRDGQADAGQACSLLCPTPSYQPSTDSGALGSPKELGQSPGPTPADGFTPSAGFF